MHEVRRQGQQPVALATGEAGDAQLHLLEVPQPAMDELGGARRGARGEVGLLHQERPQPALRGVEEDAATGDAAADHHQVERLVESGEGAGAEGGVEHR